MTIWAPGMRCVCIGREDGTRSAEFWDRWVREWKVVKPARGVVYTVRDVRMALDGTQRLRFVELVNPIVEFSDAPPQEPWWHADAFRPLSETRLNQFRKHLNRIPADKVLA